jgi:virginiamycin B lyase
VTATIDGGRGIGTDGTDVWVALGARGLVKVDPATGDTLLEIPANATYAAVGGGSVWSTHEGGIGRWDAASGELLGVIPVDVIEVTELLFAHGALWVTAKEDWSVLRIDPESNEVTATIQTGAGAHGLAADVNAVWVTNYRENSVSRIDPATNAVVATIQGVGSGVGIAAGGDAIWVSTQSQGISRIDPATNEAVLVVELPGWNYGVAYADRELWISSVEEGVVYRVSAESS